MTKSSTFPLEGQSLSNPPLFDGSKSNYHYWKKRMSVYILATDIELWKVIKYGPKVPTKEVKGELVPKTIDEWNETDAKLDRFNAMAMHMLYCALGADQFTLIATCGSAKEIWDTLETIYEGNDGVKESMSSILLNKYDSFVMKPNESILDMFVRFLEITNGLTFLGGSYSKSNRDLVRKLLWSLHPWSKWEPKVVPIEEFRDLNTLSLHELVSSLMTYELKIKSDDERNVIMNIN